MEAFYMKPLAPYPNGWTEFREIALTDIRSERRNQFDKWGLQVHTPPDWMVILMEEVGEAARELMEKNLDKFRREMVQVAAVAAAIIQSIDAGEA